MDSHHKPDSTDLAILEVLQKKGRTKQSAIAEMTGLSVPAVGERLKRLEENGFIAGYRAIVGYGRLGFDVTAFVVVMVDSSKHYRAFLNKVSGVDEILECHAITGEGTHMLKVRVRNTQALEKLLSKIQSWQGVARTMTRVVLSSPKETTYVPLAVFGLRGERLNKEE